MTSNVCSDTIKRQSTLGFSPSPTTPVTSGCTSAYSRRPEDLCPEFLHRLDDMLSSARSRSGPHSFSTGISKDVQRSSAEHRSATGREGEDFLVIAVTNPQYGVPPQAAAWNASSRPLAERFPGHSTRANRCWSSQEGDHRRFRKKRPPKGAFQLKLTTPSRTSGARIRAPEATPCAVKYFVDGERFVSLWSWASPQVNPNLDGERRSLGGEGVRAAG